jgi:protein ImuB
LALDIHPPGNSPVRAVIDKNNSVQSVSTVARAVGIETGMSAGAAAALSSVLQSLPRDRCRELKALEQAARRCCRLTPTVSLAPPDAVVLEVRGSLKLFGGFEGIQSALKATLTPLGHDYHWAAAPTPEASLLLARCRQEIKIEGRERLRSALGGLPLYSLDIDTNLLMRLHKTGIRQLRDLWRLPRAGLARRFGPELVAYLDRIHGERPDPRALYRPPLQFRSQLELPAATAEYAMILATANQLFRKLVRFLRRHDAGTAAVCVRLLHLCSSFTAIHVGTRQHTRDAPHLLHLFDQTLQRRELPEPVAGLDLLCADIRSFTPTRQDLFRNTASEDQDWQHTLEELEARLGSEAIRHIESVDDHRPEKAWIYRVPTGRRVKPRQRPLWLLSRPQQLTHRDRRLWYRGYLTLHSGPERIESGWWDGQDCRRDYYIASNPRGVRLWIFQDLKQQSDTWYLHGLFA